MKELTINTSTKASVDRITKNPPQSLLLAGERGVGLYTIAKHIAGLHLAAELHPQDVKGDNDGQNGTISVEAIRRLYQQTRAKHTERRSIIIDDADRMSLGAQAAFLKLLEEPNPHTYFILTSHTPEKLLPTIRSRVQQQIIPSISQQQTSELIKSLGVTDSTRQAQLIFIAQGLPAEIIRLQGSEEHFQARAAVMSDARRFLQAQPYEQLLILQKYQSDRPAALELIDCILLVARRSLSAKPQTGLVRQLERLLQAQTNITSNYSVRLQLANLVL